MYMRLRCTGMLRHLPLLIFVELTASKYFMISYFTLHVLSDLVRSFVSIPLYSLWSGAHGILLVTLTEPCALW